MSLLGTKKAKTQKQMSELKKTDDVSYLHKKNKRSRSIRIRIDHDGSVVVSSPPRMPQFFIDKFVKESASWIQKKLLEIRALRPSKNMMLFCGKEYEIVVDQSAAQSVVLNEGVCVVRPVENSHESVKRAIERWLKSRAEQTIPALVKRTKEKMDVSVAQLRLKDQKTRWGSCSRERSVQINWRLMQAPPEILEYVVIHELAHIKEMNHSRAFWSLVEQYDPLHKEHRAWLRKNGHALR